MDIKDTIRYLATGLIEWENLTVEERHKIPKSLRLGMSQLYAISILHKINAPANLPEFFNWAKQPIKHWKPAENITEIPDNATFIDDDTLSDFTREWAVSGNDIIAQVQEGILKKVKDFCQEENLDNSYRKYRELIIRKPVIHINELSKEKNTHELLKLGEYFKNEQTYQPLTKLYQYDEYHLCPRCKYIKRKRGDGKYTCKNSFCHRLTQEDIKLFPPLPPIPKQDVDDWFAINWGVYLFGTLPGIPELQLFDELTKLGLQVTLYPHVDQYDLLVEFPNKIKWAIDVKDWTWITPEKVKQVYYQKEANRTFVVFPDKRDDFLKISAIRQQKAYKKLNGLELKLVSEIIKLAKKELKNA